MLFKAIGNFFLVAVVGLFDNEDDAKSASGHLEDYGLKTSNIDIAAGTYTANDVSSRSDGDETRSMKAG